MKNNVIITREDNHFISVLHLAILYKIFTYIRAFYMIKWRASCLCILGWYFAI